MANEGKTFYEVSVVRNVTEEVKIGVHADSEEEAIEIAMASKKVNGERSGAWKRGSVSDPKAIARERTYKPGISS